MNILYSFVTHAKFFSLGYKKKMIDAMYSLMNEKRRMVFGVN